MCNIVLSDKLESPIISEADIMLIFDERSLKEYQNIISPNGVLVMSSMIDADPDVTAKEVVKVPFYEIAESLGSSKAANVVALGFILRYLPMIPYELIESEVAASFAKKPQLIPLNKEALRKGYECQL